MSRFRGVLASLLLQLLLVPLASGMRFCAGYSTRPVAYWAWLLHGSLGWCAHTTLAACAFLGLLAEAENAMSTLCLALAGGPTITISRIEKCASPQ